MTPVHHAINYVEITVTDMDAAQHFYTAAFGWRFTDYAPAVKDAGGTIAEEPYAFPGGRRFTFFDPSGNRLGVWSTT